MVSALIQTKFSKRQIVNYFDELSLSLSLSLSLHLFKNTVKKKQKTK